MKLELKSFQDIPNFLLIILQYNTYGIRNQKLKYYYNFR